MKIGLLSDTHIPRAAPDLPKAVYRAFKNVDLILHAGDLVTLDLLSKLKKIAPTEAVYGNMDSWEVRKKLPEKKIITAKNFRIGLIHGQGHPKNLIEMVTREFTDVDVIVFGHSHEPMAEKIDNILYVNPGSPTDKVFAPYNSYAILNLDEGIEAEIIRLD